MNQNIIQKDNIFFELNHNDFTAEIIYSPKARGHVFFPSTINYQSNEYNIINIKEGSFKNNTKIISITFLNDSKLQSISNNSFFNSNIKSINISSSVEELEDGWCNNTPKLKHVTISENRNFKFLDDDNQIIVGKSDKSTEIYDTIYFANRNIERAIIPPHIKYIKPYAFANCRKLQKIEISENSELISIGRKSFKNTKIRSIFIPSGVKELEDCWCSNSDALETVIISPENANFKYLDEQHQIIVGKSDKKSNIFDTIYFANRKIEQVTIPKSIKYIRSCSFEFCKKLTTIEFSKDSEIVSIGKKSFQNSRISSFFIPQSTVELDDCWCSYLFKLKTVTISPENANFKYLDEQHQIIVGKSDKKSNIFDTIYFANRNIEHAFIPESIKYIRSCSFEFCEKLTTIEFSKDSEIVSIGKNAFYSSSIEEITIPRKVKTIHKGAFKYCTNLSKVVFEEGSDLVSLEKGLFESCKNLKTIVIPENSSLKTIHNCFNDTNIETIFIPSSVEELEDNWFSEARKLISVTISSSNPNMKYLDDQNQIIIGKSNKNDNVFDTILFANRAIKNAIIPKSIKYINPHAFERCKKLKTIEIPEDSELESIGEKAFAICGIKKIYIPPNVEYLDDEWCDGALKLKKVIISPMNRNFKYMDQKHRIVVGKSDKNNDVFDTIYFANRNITKIVIPQTIKIIKSNAFQFCYNLKRLEMPDSKIEIIGKCAFSEIHITHLTIPKSVCKINSMAFDSCDNLLSVEIEKGSKLHSLNFLVFNFCTKLKSFRIQDDSSLKKIGYSPFSFTKIESLFIPASVECIKYSWLKYTDHIKTITVSPNNKNFKYLDEKNQIIVGKSDKFTDDYDTIYFANHDIENAIIPNSIKYIKSDSFMNCDALKTFDILEGSKMKTLSYDSFSCKNIETLKIPSNIEELVDNWCNNFPKLKNIIISPDNPNIKYLDKEHQIVVGKSIKNKDVFDTIYMASRNVKHAEIPKSIKYIKSQAFNDCKMLKYVEIPDDSLISSIGSLAFSQSSIVCFKYPKNLFSYELNFLNQCKDLLNIEFLGNIFINERDGIFKKCTKLILVSFPNIKKLNIYINDFSVHLPNQFVLYVNADAETIIINDENLNGDDINDDDISDDDISDDDISDDDISDDDISDDDISDDEYNQ